MSTMLIGCASNIRQALPENSQVDTSVSYLVGDFINSYRESSRRMALRFECSGELSPLVIELQQPEKHTGLSVYPVIPGQCMMTEELMLAFDGTVNGRYPISDSELSKPFLVEAGSVYYLGHYDGQAKNPYGWLPLGAVVVALEPDTKERDPETVVAGFDVYEVPEGDIKAKLSSRHPDLASWPVKYVYDLDEPRRENRFEQ